MQPFDVVVVGARCAGSPLAVMLARRGLSVCVVDKARFLATQARDPAAHYQHSVIGYNYRMSNILAAVGRFQ